MGVAGDGHSRMCLIGAMKVGWKHGSDQKKQVGEEIWYM